MGEIDSIIFCLPGASIPDLKQFVKKLSEGGPIATSCDVQVYKVIKGVKYKVVEKLEEVI